MTRAEREYSVFTPVSCYLPESPVPDELLQGLAFVFGAPTIPALDLVDNRSVSRLLSPSGRYAYQVLGRSGAVYTCLANSLYCSCPAFFYSVVRKSDVLLCKHLLAAHVSEALGQCTEVLVSDSTMAELMAFREN
uniref:zinc finger SWIM domain-containing protein 7 n=1 Tax=Myxine glutinosa TaxID=7769 RepID=UPI00358EC6AD